MIAGLALLGATLCLARGPILLAVGDYLVVQDDLQPTDVIHVIAGPDYRTDYAIELYQLGYGKQLLFTGGWCPEIQGDHGERAQARAFEQGVPAAAFIVDETTVTSTYAELLRLKEIVAQSPDPVRSVTVVSDPFHMHRTQWAARQVLGAGVRVQMAPVPFEVSPHQRRWWADEASRQLVGDEYGKMAYYYARYGLGWEPLGEWLASLDRR